MCMPYKILHKYKVVPKEKRLEFLIAACECSNPIPPKNGPVTMRSAFNRMRGWRFIIRGLECYCCDAPAQIRHHVTPLHKGGRNKDNNIVPLCKSCHAEIHPWLAT